MARCEPPRPAGAPVLLELAGWQIDRSRRLLATAMMAFQWRPPNPPKSPEVEGIETAKALGLTIPQYAGLTAGGRGHRRRHDRAQGGALSRPAAPTAAPT